MNLLSSKKMIGVISLLIIAAVLTVLALPNDKVDFNTQVKPILNKKCISCHGGVKQKSGFSLLFEEEALGKTESGKTDTAAIATGNGSCAARYHTE